MIIKKKRCFQIKCEESTELTSEYREKDINKR